VERGIRLRFDSPDPRPAIVLGEGARLEQVFENLVANALSFSPDRGWWRSAWRTTIMT
jgi:two-component system sensor histidine kinase ChvG